VKLACALVVSIVALAASVASADVGSVSPGKLARPHAAFESQCNRCHVPFGGVPASSCLACHTRLADRVARGQGFHATVTAKPCTACHGDHKGRDAALSPAPPTPFDHRVAVFPLEGRHADLACERCHPANRWVGIANACARCHADSAHKGALGGGCAKCHRAESWKPATRTAANHEVSLAGGHAKLACADCHRAGSHLVAKQTCTQCHAPKHGGTTRACESCHAVAGWKQVTYVHRFPPSKLPGKHQTAPCLACHAGFKFAATPFDCTSCHDKQRPHAPLGECTKCHSALSWKTNAFDHDDPQIAFPLTGKHKEAACRSCHPDPKKLAGAKRECDGCHRNVHGERVAGRTCETCHETAAWKPSLIRAANHDRFPLRNGHARAACAGCHRGDALAAVPTACSDCHADVRHRGRFGAACERCHDDAGWAHTPAFDHATTGFALERGHANVACAKCHGTTGVRLAAVAAPTACTTCHASPHGKQFGSACAQCHSTASFRGARFDHARTDFPLELRHAALACAACHTPARPVANRACRSCHGDPHRGGNSFDCSDCHRADRWRLIRFDHDLTAYPLTGRHRLASCGGCHQNPTWTGVRTDCVACHAFDRPRDGLHLTKILCDDCHSTGSWRNVRARRRR
jgi:hypothetical protein